MEKLLGFLKEINQGISLRVNNSSPEKMGGYWEILIYLDEEVVTNVTAATFDTVKKKCKSPMVLKKIFKRLWELDYEALKLKEMESRLASAFVLEENGGYTDLEALIEEVYEREQIRKELDK